MDGCVLQILPGVPWWRERHLNPQLKWQFGVAGEVSGPYLWRAASKHGCLTTKMDSSGANICMVYAMERALLFTGSCTENNECEIALRCMVVRFS